MCVPILASVGRLAHPRTSHRRVVPWAALGFSIIWGTVIGLAATRGATELAAFAGVGMLFTLALTVLLYRQQAELRDLAETDPLTGLINHRGFQQALRGELRRASLKRESVALVAIDIDDFKAVNDTHGHDVGDQVLQMVAQRLQTFVRGGDTVSRRGGDEFLFLMLEAKDENNAANLAAKIIDNIAQPCEVEGVKLTVRPSIGIAVYPEDGESVQELLKNADTAMYVAKQQKSGRALYSQVAPAGAPSQQR